MDEFREAGHGHLEEKGNKLQVTFTQIDPSSAAVLKDEFANYALWQTKKIKL
jgi:hypothetical protein